MNISDLSIPRTKKLLVALLSGAMISTVLAGCSGTAYQAPTPVVQVGTSTAIDPNLPTEPSLPTSTQVCSTLYASDSLIARPDGSLPPEADPSVAGVGVAASATTTNPDQARIQAALNACGVSVDAAVGARIAAADAAATAAQVAASVPNVNISGVSAEELRKPIYQAPQFAVRLVVSNTPNGGNAFISGPLVLPSGVTLWIDKGVTLFASRDVMQYVAALAGPYCGNVAVSATKAGSSSNCAAFITGTNLVNSAVMGDGSIDGRGYSEIVTTNKLYPLIKVDLTCSNTYAAYKTGTQAVQGTSCDNGGTTVDLASSARNMTWWDLAWLGNMIDSGATGVGSQSVPRLMVYNYAKNLTLYRITMNNSPNFHVVPAGVDGFVVWDVKVQTPSLAAYQNPTGNGNPLYTGVLFTTGGGGPNGGDQTYQGNVKNTDAFDPASVGKLTSGYLTTGGNGTTGVTIPSATGKIAFDGYLKNLFFVHNYVSTGDDDIALKGSSNPSPSGCTGCAGVDGSRGVFSTLPYGIVIAHNHMYGGHGISIGSETNAGVQNVQVYDNSFDNGEEGLRIKTDVARGGLVQNIYYNNICMHNMDNALLFTPYYSSKALPAGGPLYPDFKNLFLNNISIEGAAVVMLQGYAAQSGPVLNNPQYPLIMTLNNVVAESPANISLIDSDANLTLTGLNNLPIVNSSNTRVSVTGTASEFVDPAVAFSTVLDCTQAYVDFPTTTSPTGTTWPIPPLY
jgi:polygalacturonase